jgi:hypothetical protein
LLENKKFDVNPEADQLQKHLNGPGASPQPPPNQKTTSASMKKIKKLQIFGHCWVNPDVGRPNHLDGPWSFTPSPANPKISCSYPGAGGAVIMPW